MQTTESVRNRIDIAQQLDSVVSTMRAMAAVNVSRFEKVLNAAQAYRQTVDRGLQVVLRNVPESIDTVQTEPAEPGIGMVVFGTDQGLCGDFNGRIASHARTHIADLNATPAQPAILAVGTRLAIAFRSAGREIDDQITTAASVGTVGLVVQDIASRVARWRSERNIDRVYMYFNRRTGGAAYQPEARRLLPLSRRRLEELKQSDWPSKVLPIFTMDWHVLLRRLVRQCLLASIHTALAHSLVSENASRVASMQNAQRNIEERIEDLQSHYRQLRQTSITSELLDIVSGFEALRDESDGDAL